MEEDVGTTVCEEERRDRARRLQKVVDLCVALLRNLAFYRTGWEGRNRRFAGEPYRTFNANCFDQIYLEWCKLFGSWNEEHHWRKVVTDSDCFEEGLLAALDCGGPAFEVFHAEMKEVRDRVVAHQDVYEEIPTPTFDKALQSVSYLLIYIYENEVGQEIKLKYRYDPSEIYERFRRWGTTFWNGEEPTPDDRRLLTLRTVRLDQNGP